jgi:hypothetical protein
VSALKQGGYQKRELTIVYGVYGRIYDLPLRIILTEKTKSNLRVLWEMARESVLMPGHCRLMDGGPGRVFTEEIRSKDGVSKKCQWKKGSFLHIEDMNVEKRNCQDPRY